MNYYLGIDGGLHGGWALVDDNGKLVETFEMPIIKGDRNEYDLKTIAELLAALGETYPEVVIYFEKAAPRPIQGVRAAFVTGYGYGVIKGIAAALELPFEIVDPKTWQKKILPQTTGDTKQASKLFAVQRCPNHNWKGTERSLHDGLTDAYCIAMYGWLKSERRVL